MRTALRLTDALDVPALGTAPTAFLVLSGRRDTGRTALVAGVTDERIGVQEALDELPAGRLRTIAPDDPSVAALDRRRRR